MRAKGTKQHCVLVALKIPETFRGVRCLNLTVDRNQNKDVGCFCAQHSHVVHESEYLDTIRPKDNLWYCIVNHVYDLLPLHFHRLAAIISQKGIRSFHDR